MTQDLPREDWILIYHRIRADLRALANAGPIDPVGFKIRTDRILEFLQAKASQPTESPMILHQHQLDEINRKRRAQGRSILSMSQAVQIRGQAPVSASTTETDIMGFIIGAGFGVFTGSTESLMGVAVHSAVESMNQPDPTPSYLDSSSSSSYDSSSSSSDSGSSSGDFS